MTCKQARAAAIEYARSGTGPTDPHFVDCAECAGFLAVQFEFQSVLQTLPGQIPPSPNLESILLAKFETTPRKVARWTGAWLSAAALAACLAVTTGIVHRRPVRQPVVEEPFVEIPFIAPLAPYERTTIVQMDLPIAALIAAGFEVHTADAGQVLRADVLFGQDGRAHALRLINRNLGVIE